MSQPQTASERAAWVRDRAKLRGMAPQAYAEYVAALRKDYAIIAGPGARIVSGLGLGNVAVPEAIRADAETRLLAMQERRAA